MLVSGGCNSWQRIQYPTTFFPDRETQRKTAQIQDPYPDASIGPSVGFRPLNFQEQRAEPQQVRDRYYSSFLKSHFGGAQPTPMQTTAVPMMGPQMAGQPSVQPTAQAAWGPPPQLAGPTIVIPQTASHQGMPQYMATPQMAPPYVATPHMSTPQMASPQMVGPQMASPVYAPPYSPVIVQ